MGAGGEPDVGPIRIVVADDHWIVREGLRRFLLSDPEFQVVGEAENGLEAVRLAKELRPDVVLMDLLMPELDGVVAIEAVHRELPEVALLALTSAAENELVVGAMRAGATGYILKDSGGDELKRAIRAAAAGQVHLSPQVAAHLLRGIRMPQQPLALTDREQDVLRLLARGLANKEIARALGIGDGTVKTHVSSILAKLRVQGRTQAALAAIQLGLVTPDQLRKRWGAVQPRPSAHPVVTLVFDRQRRTPLWSFRSIRGSHPLTPTAVRTAHTRQVAGWAGSIHDLPCLSTRAHNHNAASPCSRVRGGRPGASGTARAA